MLRATLTEPATTGPSGALFRALRSVDVDPDPWPTAPTMSSAPRPASGEAMRQDG